MNAAEIHALIDQNTFINRSFGLMEIGLGQRGEAWLAARRVSIGGTAASVLTGKNPYTKLPDLWDEMVLGTRTPENLRMRIGTALEPFVLELLLESLQTEHPNWELYEGLTALSPITYEFEGEKLRNIASLDGVLRGPNLDFFVAEAKTTSEGAWKAGGSKPYPYHIAQVQHYLAVTGWDAGYIGYLIGNSRFERFLITPEPGWFDALHGPAISLLGSIHLGKRPEEAAPKGEAPRSGGTWIEAGPVETEVCRHFIQTKSMIDQLETELGESETFLKDLIGTKQAAGILGDGFGLKAIFTKGRASTDWKGVAAHAGIAPETIAQFTKTGNPGIRLEEL